MKQVSTLTPFSSKRLFLSTKMPYGKYKDQTVYDIIKVDVSYMDWLEANVNNNWDDKVTMMFKEFWERKNEKQFGFRNKIK